MLRIVTDGATDLPAWWEEEFDIQIVPIIIYFGEETYLQYVDMTLPAFYEKKTPVLASQKHPNLLPNNLRSSVRKLPMKTTHTRLSWLPC